MSFIYRDFLTPSRFSWNKCSALYHKFNKVWGRETIDGVEVYSSKLIYWSGSVRSDTAFKRFINSIGVEYSALTNAEYEGVDNVYFELQPSKYSYESKEKTAIASDLNSVFSVDDEFELYVHYTGQSKRVVHNHFKYNGVGDQSKISSYVIDKDDIRTTLHSDPIKYFANASLKSSGSLTVRSASPLSRINLIAKRVSPRSTPISVVEYDEDLNHLYSVFALFDNGSMFQQQGNVYSEIVTVKQTKDTVVYYEYSYKIKYKVIALASEASYIVNQIDLISNAMQNSLNAKSGNIYLISNHVADTKIKEAVIAMNNIESVSLTYGGKLRVDSVADMKRKEFAKMLGKILGTGYTKKKTKWHQKALAFVIIVVAVAIFYFSGGTGAAISGNMLALSASLALSATALSIGMAVYAAVFPYATDQTRIIGKFAQVVGYLAMVTGIYAAIQNSFRSMANEAVKKGAIESANQYTVSQYISDMFNSIIDDVSSQISDMFSFSNISEKFSPSNLSDITMKQVSGWLDNMNTAMKMYMKFFGDKEEYKTAEDEQAVKEDGVEPIYAAVSMIDEVDSLTRMDFMIKNNNGGQLTENFLTKIS